MDSLREVLSNSPLFLIILIIFFPIILWGLGLLWCVRNDTHPKWMGRYRPLKFVIPSALKDKQFSIIETVRLEGLFFISYGFFFIVWGLIIYFCRNIEAHINFWIQILLLYLIFGVIEEKIRLFFIHKLKLFRVIRTIK